VLRRAGKFNHLREEVDPDNQSRAITSKDEEVRIQETNVT